MADVQLSPAILHASLKVRVEVGASSKAENEEPNKKLEGMYRCSYVMLCGK